MQQKIVTLLAAAGLALSASAQIDLSFPAIQPPDTTELKSGKPVIKTSISGVVTASAFVQDGSFGMGDGSITMWASAAQPGRQEYQAGGDLRKTWLIFKATAFNLPEGWTASGRAEIDFLGGFAGAGGFADENLLPRVRLAYVELQKGGTRLRLGQAWTPLVAQFPTSVSHFAMGYGAAGGIGFRNPGLFLYQNLSSPRARTKVRLDAAVFRGSWTGAGNDPYGRDEGEIGIPQLELGVHLGNQAGKVKWEVNTVGHYDRKKRYSALSKDYSTLEGRALQTGIKLRTDRAVLQGNAYWGRAIGQSWGHLLQFGDIEGNGAWAQAGFLFTRRLSGWVMYGYDNPYDNDVETAVAGNARLHNQVLVPMVKYDLGPLSLSLEWFRARTQWRTVQDGTAQRTTATANQLALGASFIF